MTPQVMVQPSSLMYSGVQITQAGGLKLFRFTEDLQARSDELLERSKIGLITPDEAAELAGISELSRIFTFINAQLAAQAKWCPTPLDNLYADGPNTSVNTVTPQNT